MKYIVVKDLVPDISFKTIIKQKMFRNNFCFDTLDAVHAFYVGRILFSFWKRGAGADVYVPSLDLTMSKYTFILFIYFKY